MTKTSKLLAIALMTVFALTLLVAPNAVLAKKKQAKAKGPITAIVADTISVLDLKSGEEVDVTVDENTSIHKDNNETATLEDLAVGDRAKVRYNKDTFVAARIHAKGPQVKGEITAVDPGNGGVTIQPAEGDPVTVFVTDETKLRKDDDLATLEELAPGDHAKAWYDAATMEASKLIATSPEVEEE